MKSILFFLFFLGANIILAQGGVDTPYNKMDTNQVRPAPSPKTPTANRNAAQTHISTSLPQAKKDSLIKNIRAIFQRINHDTTLHAVNLDEETIVDIIGGSPDNGGEVTGYFKKDTLYKLVMNFGPSFGMKKSEYYYDKGQVVFIYEKDQHFPVRKDGGLDHERLVVGFEGRFYFNKGRLISKVIKRYDQLMAETIDDNYIRDLLEVASPYVKALRRRLPHHPPTPLHPPDSGRLQPYPPPVPSPDPSAR